MERNEDAPLKKVRRKRARSISAEGENNAEASWRFDKVVWRELG